MNLLFIINDAPYGSEKAYNALRMAMSLQKDANAVDIWIFLMADAVTCALATQTTPSGYYNIERMLKAVINRGGQIKACGSCAQARGITETALIDGIEISTLQQLTQWTVAADKVLTF